MLNNCLKATIQGPLFPNLVQIGPVQLAQRERILYRFPPISVYIGVTLVISDQTPTGLLTFPPNTAWFIAV